MKGKGLSFSTIADAAFQLAEERGYGNYSVRDLAVRLDVKAASLYNHISSVEDINREVGKQAAAMLNRALTNAIEGKRRGEALTALAYAYRAFVQEKPELYRSILGLPSLSDSEELRNVAKESFQAIRTVMEQYQIPRQTSVHFARCFRSALHGFIILQMDGYYTNKNIAAEDSFRFLIEGYISWADRLEEESRNDRQRETMDLQIKEME